MSFEGIPMHRCRRSIPMNPSRSILLAVDLWIIEPPTCRPFQDALILRYLHRANNAPLDKNAINLAEIPVFERCFKYGTSPDYIPKKVKETPEMIVSVKLYA